MRLASYILLALVMIFLTNAAASLVSPSYRTILRETKAGITGQKAQLEANQNNEATQKLLTDSLDRIDKSISTLSNNTGSMGPLVEGVATSSGDVLSGATVAAVAPIPVPIAPIEQDVAVSGIFLAKIMPDITLKKIENPGIFNIFIFDKIRYTTYQDEKRHIKVYAFNEGYDTMLTNLKLTSSVYTINETDQFFGYTFFLNGVKKDDIIRFVTSLEWHAIGVEVPKRYYSALKKMLSKP